MKLFIKNIQFILVLLGLAVIYSSCNKEPEIKIYTYPTPVPSGITPASGYSGTYVTITGSSFGDYNKAIKVFFGGVQADSVISCVDDEILVKVPDNALTGKVTLQVWTHAVDSIGSYTVLPTPGIISVDMERVQVGDIVTITGINFGSDANAFTLFIGENQANIISVKNTEIKFEVPDGSSATLVIKFGELTIKGPYLLIGDEMITGTLIGHSSSWGDNPATYITAAVDGDIETFVDASSNTGYVGYDVGSGKAASLTSVRYVPRSSHPQRMMGGEIRGANDPALIDAVTLYTIAEEPATGVYTEVPISATENYRYIYYYSADGFCNIAEIEFYGNIVDAEIPVGKYIYEFDNPRTVTLDVLDDWIGRPDQSSWAGSTTTIIEDGYCKVTFAAQSDGVNKNRADFVWSFGGDWGSAGSGIDKDPWVYSSEFPIYAIKVHFVQGDGSLGGPRPANGSIYYDRLGQFNDDYVDQNVLWVDASTWAAGEDIKEEGSWWQLKVADILSDEQGYWVDWHRTFSSVEELNQFLGN